MADTKAGRFIGGQMCLYMEDDYIQGRMVRGTFLLLWVHVAILQIWWAALPLQLGFGLVPLKLEIESPSVGILIVITKLRWKVSCLHCPKTYLHWRHCGEKVRNRTFSLLLFLPEKHLFNNFDALNELKPKYLITYCAMLAAAVLSAITRRRTCSK